MSGGLNRHESKYFNSARLMDEALLLLLDKKDYEYITVKEICQKAGVNRSTFYLHYESMDDLLSETLEYMSARFDKKLSQSIAESGDTVAPLSDLVLVTPKYVKPYLEYLKEHKRVYMAAMRQKNVFGTEVYSRRVCADIVSPILGKMNVPAAEQKYVAAFYVAGLHSLVFEWVRGGCVEDIDFICELMMRFASGKEKE